VPGLTNRVLARLASRVLQAFPGTWQERLHPLTCGNPVRQDVAALDAPGERLVGRSGPVRVLVTGGSQGARALNRLLPAALRLAPEGLSLEVRHQCGRSWQEETEAAYRAAGFEISGSSPVGAASAAISEPPAGDIAAEAAPTAAPTAGARCVVKVTEFIEDMADAYGWADLVVCRAGALTMSEVAAAGVAAVFVPFPHAVDDHQTRNAEYLTERGAALLLGEAGLDAERLARDLNPLLADRARLLDMATRARGAATPDAAKRVAGLCSEYLTS